MFLLFLFKMRFVLSLVLTIAISSNAQNYYNNWYFGDRSGISFNGSSPKSLINSKLFTREGCSSISDGDGNLIFYTDGETVWNKNHDTMKNGYGLFGNGSSTQSALIVKQPGNVNIYYIFTADAFNSIPNYWNLNSKNKGFNYSIVDMNLDSGLGEVTYRNISLFKNSNEKITAVEHSNGKDIWIATIKRFSDTIYLYQLTTSGLSPATIHSNNGNKIGLGNAKKGTGYMKFSSKGKYLAYIDGDDSSYIHLFNFDRTSGALQNHRRINYFSGFNYGPYGIEFSPNENYLYVSTGFPAVNGNLFQIPIDSIYQNVNFFKIAIKINKSNTDKISGGIQLAPDGKIYVAMIDTFLSVINHPDSTALSCKFKLNAISLKDRSCLVGLPNCVQSQVYNPIQIVSDTSCWLDSAHFMLKNTKIKSVLWDFGDGISLYGNSNEIRHLYKDSGTYLVSVKASLINGIDTLIYSKIRIEYIQYPLLGNDTILCFSDSISLNVYHSSIATYKWEDSSQNPTKTIYYPGNYRLVITNTYCHAIDSFKVSYGKKPLVYLGNDTTFCHKFSKLLDAGRGFKSYKWNTGENTYSITAGQEGIYSVKVLDSLSCEAGDTIRLVVSKKPMIQSYFDTLTCKFVQLSLERKEGTSYIWSTGDTGTHLKVYKKDVYSVTASNLFCSFSDTFNVNILPRPEVHLGSDTILCSNTNLSTDEKGVFLWNDGQATQSILIYRPGVYWLKVSRNHCESTDTISLKPCMEITYYTPNAFSPNQDLINDCFKVYGNNIETLHMEIFNSWGEKILDESGVDSYWDGSYMNEICPQGVYSYLIEIQGYNKKKYYLSGTIHLLR